MNITDNLITYLKSQKDPNWREYWAAIDWLCYNIKNKEIDEILK